MKRVLVTGGMGFIGSNFVRQLLTVKLTPELVVNLDKLTYAGNPANLYDVQEKKNYRFIKGDIGDENLVTKILREYRITHIVNFAAESHVDRSIDGPEAFVQTNVVGTFRLLEAAKKYWKELDHYQGNDFRFLHVSTDEVFGSLSESDPAFSETTAYAPNSPYSASKAASDHFVRAYYHTYGLPVLTTNCSNNYGPYQFPEKLIPLMILNALEGKTLPVYGDGLNVRDWLYVEDHGRAIYQVLKNGHIGDTYNIGGWNEVKNIDMVQALCGKLDELRPKLNGEKYHGQITYVKDRPGHDRRYAMDCRKIERELGWKPQETFISGLDKTIGWYLANTAWCEEIRSGKYQGQRLGRV